MAKQQRKPRRMTSAEINEAMDDASVAREFAKFAQVRLSEKQQELYHGMSDATITTVTGPPGTSKTFTCCYLAIKMLKSGKIKKIILTKPLETSGEDLGFLPGTEKDKVAPFLASFIDNLKEMVDGPTLKMMLDSGVIEFIPIAFMRGRTFKDAFIIADEIQNLDIKQMMTFITRMGVGSKVAMIGDSNQNDINKKFVALDFFIEKILGDDPEMFHYRFSREDIVRHPLLIKIVDNYEKAKESGDLPETKKKN
jgi:phosphate starvation-inducible protein PhoH and related proteins